MDKTLIQPEEKLDLSQTTKLPLLNQEEYSKLNICKRLLLQSLSLEKAVTLKIELGQKKLFHMTTKILITNTKVLQGSTFNSKKSIGMAKKLTGAANKTKKGAHMEG
jgi:hypothetical protein